MSHELTIWDLPRLLGYQFFQFALIGGVIVALSCALVGLFLILRKEAMLGDGVAHTSFGGIAIGLYLGIYPLLTALIVSVVAVLAISYMKRKGVAHSDSSIAVFLALGFSTGLIVISLAGGFNIELFSYLFGDILTIDAFDLMTVSVLGMVVLGFIGIFHKELLSVTFDAESSRLMGIPVRGLETGFSLLVALTIVLSIKVVGIILVVALLVIPGLSALQLGRSFRSTAMFSIVFGTTSVLMGLLLNAIYNVAAAGVIIFTSTGLFLFVALYKRLE